MGTTLRKTFLLPALLVVLTGGAILFSVLGFTIPARAADTKTITLTGQMDNHELEAVLAYVKERPWELYDPETDDYLPEDPDNPNTRDFRVASVDLNRDGVYEVVLEDRRQYMCGSGGCGSIALPPPAKQNHQRLLNVDNKMCHTFCNT